MDVELKDHPGWQWCTAEGAEMHTLLMGARSTFREKIQWLEEAENLTLAMATRPEKSLTEPAGGETLKKGERPGQSAAV